MLLFFGRKVFESLNFSLFSCIKSTKKWNNRGFFPEDGHGLKRLFINGRRKTTILIGLFLMTSSKTNYSAAPISVGGHCEIGPALTLVKWVHFGSIVKKYFWKLFYKAKIILFEYQLTFTKAVFIEIVSFISKENCGDAHF